MTIIILWKGTDMAKKISPIPTTLKDKVYHTILADIINGVYVSGEIITEKFLINKYQVSRSPIREALTKLTTYDILVSIPRHGYQLTQISEERLREITQFRTVLECCFLKNFSHCIKPADIADLRKLCQEYDATPQDNILDRWQFNMDFHLTLFSYYHNVHAYEILKRDLILQSIFYSLKVKTVPLTTDLHTAFLDYLEKGNIKIATDLLKADIENILVHE